MTAMEAMFYEKIGDERVRCNLCPHQCRLKPGQAGLCRIRTNREGVLMTHNYGEISSLALDPIEKKPLFHFYPGTYILSAGSYGCNLACSFCQNYAIAHGNPPTRFIEPEKLVEITDQSRSKGSIGIAYTYNEPSIWYEYLMAVAPRIKERGMKNVLVTNGYIEKEPLEKLLPYIDAFNIDMKAFNKSFYPQLCSGQLQPVKDTVERISSHEIHMEVTTLIIPGMNDSDEEISNLARWLASLNPKIVLHLSRYHPAYKLNLPPTPEATLKRVYQTAREHLDFVYTGNLPGEQNDTHCLNCGNLLIARNAYRIETKGIEQGECKQCHQKIDYIQGL